MTDKEHDIAALIGRIEEHGAMPLLTLDSPLEIRLHENGTLWLRYKIPMQGSVEGVAIGVALTPAATSNLVAGLREIEKILGRPIEDLCSPNQLQ